jgi:diguanylate cyclase (GGDEF)-like protein
VVSNTTATEKPNDFKDLNLHQLLASPVIKLLPPILLLAVSLGAMFSAARVSPAWQVLVIQALPLASMGIALLLSIRFNRSRYTLLLLLIAVAGLSQTLWRGQLLPATENLLFALLIVNAFAFSLLRDRGLFSVHGLARMTALALQAVAIWYLATHTSLLPQLLLEHEWFTPPDSLAIFVQLADGIIVIALLVNLAHMILSLARNSSIQATFFGCQLGLLGIASGYPHATFVPLMVSACGFMVTLAIIMDSHDMAYRDELTGLPSRRALNQRLLGLGRRYAIAMLDIDHFKKFNDTHGHDIGDEVLRMVAMKIARVGGGGKAYRYGGEEFTVVFPGKTAVQAQPHLEALRASIEDYRMLLRRRPRKGKGSAGKKARVVRGKNNPQHRSLAVTVSIGYAERNPQLKLPETVVKAADTALYRAKKQGRNRLSY